MWNHLGLLLATSLLATAASQKTCKVVPSSPEWPSSDIWAALNSSVNGNLLKVSPIASPCFSANFQADECQKVKDNWQNAHFYLSHPGAIMDSVFLKHSCHPQAGPDGKCTLGEYPEYAVNVSSSEDVIQALEFAKKHNVRLTVKNSGHDYMGRSIGHGSLSIWTRYQRKQDWYDDYKDSWSDYRGPAVKAGAGVLGIELYTEADARGYYIVGGECPTVGFTGGYVQGGGHSVLSSYKGMAADHVLSFEVITTTGNFINASTTENPDLFWALRGGGGGTYGIVWSVTIKAFPDVHISLATITFTTSSSTNTPSTFLAAQEVYHRHTPRFTSDGAWVLAYHTPTAFFIPAFILPNRTKSETEALIAPMLHSFDDLGLKYTLSVDQYPGYLKTIRALPAFQNPPVNDAQYGGLLLPKSIWENEGDFQKVVRVFEEISAQGVMIADVAMNPSREAGGYTDNAVFPQWRTAERLIFTQIPFWIDTTPEKLLEDQKKLTAIDEKLRELFPGIGSYHNEADPNTPNWKVDFWGSTYDRLLEIKDKYDPDQLLYGRMNVGGDRWYQASDGSLCPAESGNVHDEL